MPQITITQAAPSYSHTLEMTWTTYSPPFILNRSAFDETVIPTGLYADKLKPEKQKAFEKGYRELCEKVLAAGLINSSPVFINHHIKPISHHYSSLIISHSLPLITYHQILIIAHHHSLITTHHLSSDINYRSSSLINYHSSLIIRY
jgi:hypothetical protein